MVSGAKRCNTGLDARERCLRTPVKQNVNFPQKHPFFSLGDLYCKEDTLLLLLYLEFGQTSLRRNVFSLLVGTDRLPDVDSCSQTLNYLLFDPLHKLC